uniref:ATP-dependent DNA helicase DinG n=1 Tax=Thaumasiovibrio occultus TaxID=1891184 RepID=UPI000B355A95|nr:ATP-dependent DNA helicase DinG [Thaumasiovibrio occultus]
MLNSATQTAIKKCYHNLQAQLPLFVPRRAQNYLVSEIAKTLAGQYNKQRRILVAEAGTGTGKSMAYLMGAIPLAMETNRTVVISTATVALQEQLLNKDLPLFQRIYEREVNVRLAKGRQRYCCAHKLSSLSEGGEPQQALWVEKPKKKDLELLTRLLTALGKGKWDGDRDNWPTTIPDRIWLQIVSDKHSCSSSMPFHRQCPFAKARDSLAKANVVIVNHALLMADLELGGGIILPEPELSFYLIDEAHHLPHVARDFSAASASLLGTSAWLESLNQRSAKLAAMADIKQAGRFLTSLQDNLQVLIPGLRGVHKQIDPIAFSQDKIYRFAHGVLPAWLEEEAKSLKESSKKCGQALGKIHDLIAERVKLNEVSAKQAEPAIAECGFFLQRLENVQKVWELMAAPIKDHGAPPARWLSTDTEREGDYLVEVSPIDVGWRLDNMLWSRAAGVVLTSATIRALNKFSYFCHQAGLYEDDGTRFLALSSPFDFAEQGQLLVPALSTEPTSPDFTDTLIKELPRFLADDKASLVLFASYWQMNQVADKIRPLCTRKGWQLLIQGDESRQTLLEKHKKQINAGKVSILFGTGSFSEGLDLPGDLLTNVIITKIPFAVPTSPIEAAQAEYIEKKGGNPFLQITVPEASKKLIQSVGRLLRKEQDSGRVVLLDRRVVTKRYGKALLDALPPFSRIIEPAQSSR